MKYLKLTNTCQSFNAISTDDSLHLYWNTSINLAPFKYASLLRIQMGPVKADDHNRLVSLHTNIIARTLHNPLREIACIHIPRRSQFLESTYVKGQLQNMSEYFLTPGIEPNKTSVQTEHKF